LVKEEQLEFLILFFLLDMQKYRLFLLFFFLPFLSFSQSWKPENGSKDRRNHYTVFRNANIYAENGTIIKNGELLIQNDKIVALGKNLELPKNTVEINLKGHFIYPSFIDLYSHYGIEKHENKTKTENKKERPQLESKKPNQFYWNEAIKPEISAATLFEPNKEVAKKLRKMGFGTVLTHQQDGIIRGTGALVSLADEQNEPFGQMLLSEAAMEYAFKKGASKQTYPNSLMGIIALIRQVHYDLRYYENAKETEYNHSLEALVQAKKLPKIIDAGSTASLFRAHQIAEEFDFKFILKGDGSEYSRVKALQKLNAPLIVPINYPKPYDVSDPYDARRLTLSQMKEWELAPFNLQILAENKISFAISSEGIEKEEVFFKNLKRSYQNGANSDELIRALTITPATLIGADSLVGSLSPGKLANFIICSDSLFSNNFKIQSNWVQGEEYKVNPIEQVSLKGNYNLNVNKKRQFKLKIEENEQGSWKAVVKSEEQSKFIKASLKLSGHRIALSFKIDEQLYHLSGSINDSLSRIWSGKSLINGRWSDWAAIKTSISQMGEPPASTQKPSNQKEKAETPSIYYPNMAYGWDSLPRKAEAIIFRNATVWTNEAEGILKNHDVLIADGKIKMIGYKINLPVMFPDLAEEVIEIDADGKHLTSGIVDEHSHIAISRGVNESGQAITSEVRIGDVINPNDINIYRQLAGGVTTSQLLHGSANPIGGQSALIKLRWGFPAEALKIDSAEGFIKFALGENVKQSNWGDHRTVRFPQTRMGVEQVFYDGFIRAKEYDEAWKLYLAKSKREQKKAVAPRRDLELEALAEILDSLRFITCHSYIQSEINMLMHVADSLGFKINTFTHILEGYKVADKLKAHAAAASTFSDWWAYKFEVNDAIPYNGALLHRQGVLTGFNSDDVEMGRRLNQEAAKAVKYGGVSEEEAWKFVTLNPAKMLHLDHQIGSIKAGKDADLVLWSDKPLSIKSKVEQTYIDGIRFFDQERDRLMRQKIQKERERLIALMLEAKNQNKPTQKVKRKDDKLYECDTLEP